MLFNLTFTSLISTKAVFSRMLCHASAMRCDGARLELVPTKVIMFYKLICFIYMLLAHAFFNHLFFVAIHLLEILSWTRKRERLRFAAARYCGVVFFVGTS